MPVTPTRAAGRKVADGTGVILPPRWRVAAIKRPRGGASGGAERVGPLPPGATHGCIQLAGSVSRPSCGPHRIRAEPVVLLPAGVRPLRPPGGTRAPRAMHSSSHLMIARDGAPRTDESRSITTAATPSTHPPRRGAVPSRVPGCGGATWVRADMTRRRSRVSRNDEPPGPAGEDECAPEPSPARMGGGTWPAHPPAPATLDRRGAEPSVAACRWCAPGLGPGSASRAGGRGVVWDAYAEQAFGTSAPVAVRDGA